MSILTVAGGTAPRHGCPYDQRVRSSRYAVALAAGDKPAAVVLDTEADLGWALRRWLVGMVAFDRRDSCWVWLDRDENRDALVVGEANEDLTDPRAAVLAQQWAAGLLLDEDSDVRLSDLCLCGSLPPPRLTEWRTVWYAGIRHYAPLFAGTAACHVPVSDLRPATGTECCCTERER
ncbi:hypothetical protein Aca07nite_88550 [Actinoplanes capillaceus]|uniref:Uncharacterized protein n=1 Tax=Actinoplanes campanulatus TaxID=113559 RepID=A0ABQ3WZ67_9ACTN|nr:hypothetical protein [Actinoplanes capillaceus]GID51580.1 hypothetical protein Aca07nite_88550 [Actinoplanes capillaceus]